MPVQAWHMEKMADTNPAQRAMSFSGTPKNSIISGRYGFTDVRAMGSAKRHIAGGEVSDLLMDARLGGKRTENHQLLDWQFAFGHGARRWRRCMLSSTRKRAKKRPQTRDRRSLEHESDSCLRARPANEAHPAIPTSGRGHAPSCALCGPSLLFRTPVGIHVEMRDEVWCRVMVVMTMTVVSRGFAHGVVLGCPLVVRQARNKPFFPFAL
jgi:hypothetical protein